REPVGGADVGADRGGGCRRAAGPREAEDDEQQAERRDRLGEKVGAAGAVMGRDAERCDGEHAVGGDRAGDAACDMGGDVGERAHALRLAEDAKARGDPIRLQLVDVLRKHAGKVCVCELVPLFDVSQPTLSHHLKKLREAGIVDSERRGLWAYYYVLPGALKELSAWLT